VREALRDLLALQEKLVTIDNIQKTVAEYYKIKVADLLSKPLPFGGASSPDGDGAGKELTNHSCRKSAMRLAAATIPPCCTPAARLSSCVKKATTLKKIFPI
jgi:hypothetical protein